MRFPRSSFAVLLLFAAAAAAAAAAVATAPATAAAAADEVWLSFEPTSPAVGATIDIRLMEGAPFSGAEHPFAGGEVARFQRLWKNGRRRLGGEEQAPPAARFEASTSPGVELVSLTTRRLKRDDGLPVTYFCKAMIVVGDGVSGDALRYSELGHRLEIVLQTDPVKLAAGGGTVAAQVLFEREPLAGTIVHAVSAAEPTAQRRGTTDEIGLIRFRLDRPGPWMLRVSHQTPCDDCKAPSERLQSTLVLRSGG